MRPTRHARCLLACAALLAGAGPALAVTQDLAPDTGRVPTLCRAAVAELEREHRIPRQLLSAIALAESGRWDAARGESFAWPWTVTASGPSHYFETKEAALAHVRALIGAGVRNIDVGCMQINLLHHPDAFESLDQAFEPAANAAYAAGFLADLHDQTRSWSRAVSFYHSRTKAFYQPYREKVYKLWRIERERAAAAHRAEVIAAYLERKARREAATAERRRK